MTAAPAAERRPPVVLLGGRGPSLSLTRSLGRAGIAVHVLGDPDAVVRYSRYCHAFVDLGGGEGVQERWLSWLEEGPRGAVVLACHDDGLELIARHRDRLLDWGYRPMEADDDALLAMLDKQRSYAAARDSGVPVPRTWTVSSADDLDRALAEVEFPCAVKPRLSHEFARRFRAKVLLVEDERELREALELVGEQEIDAFVTEVVPGGDDRYCSYYTYLDSDGQPLFHFTKRKLRQFPPGFGLGTYHVTDWSPDVAEMGLKFLRGAGVRGLANVEFKRDSRDGRLVLIECNARFTAADHLVRAAGLDLALMTYGRLTGAPAPAVGEYRRGVTSWYPIDDLRALAAYRRRGDLTLLEWLGSVARRHAMPVFARDDARPSAMSLVLRFRSRRRRRSK